MQQVLVDNYFLKTQNVLSLGATAKLVGSQEMKSLPSSPIGAGTAGFKNRTRQLQLNGPMVSNKHRRLTNSVSSANVHEMQRTSNLTPQMAQYNTAVKQVDVGRGDIDQEGQTPMSNQCQASEPVDQTQSK